ncbi:MAG: two-component system sensor histidine kinase/response regulator [Gammaproteobacteria bacterium]|jgi:CheY-like chemotaxis protein
MKTVESSATESTQSADATGNPPVIISSQKSENPLEMDIKDSVGKHENLSKFKVLVVDDDSITREIIGCMLEPTNCIVKMAEDGFEAIIDYFEFQPDIVLMDINMPDVNGVSALKLIRNQGGVAPIIAVTASVTKGEVRGYLAAGFNDIIAKPISRQVLINKISIALTD